MCPNDDVNLEDDLTIKNYGYGVWNEEYIMQREKRLMYIKKRFSSYESIMDALSVLVCIEAVELDDVFFYINRIIEILSIIDIGLIVNYLKKNLPSNTFIQQYFEIIDAFYNISKNKRLKYAERIKHELLSTNFISQDVVNNILFEYICYKKLIKLFLYQLISNIYHIWTY